MNTQEVDHYNDYFLPNLKEKCYDGIWEKKPSNHSADGVAVFWNTKYAPVTSYIGDSLTVLQEI